LSDKKEIDTLHGKIALGILIVEDFVAAIALMILPLLNDQVSIGLILIKLALALICIALIFLFSHTHSKGGFTRIKF
jgi:predicted Kef-type K+ transport protein